MRRTEKEVTDRAEIDNIVRSSRVCRLGMSDGELPYVVPLCFGYDGVAVYFHSATQGQKLEILRRHPHVCLEFDVAGDIVQGEPACAWGQMYRSAIAFGEATFVESPEERRKGLRLLTAQYADPDRPFSFADAGLSRVVVIKVEIDQITGKQSA